MEFSEASSLESVGAVTEGAAPVATTCGMFPCLSLMLMESSILGSMEGVTPSHKKPTIENKTSFWEQWFVVNKPYATLELHMVDNSNYKQDHF